MEAVLQILTVVIPVVFGSGGIVMYLLSRHDARSKKIDKILETVEQHTETINGISDKVDLLADATCETLHDMLMRLYEEYIRQDYLIPEQKALWNKTYATGVQLGVDGETKVMNEQILKMEVKPESSIVGKVANHG